MKKRISNKKRAIVSAVSALTLCAACVAPAYYGTDIFCGISASAEGDPTEIGLMSQWSDYGGTAYFYKDGTLLYKDDAEGETTEIRLMWQWSDFGGTAYFYTDGTVVVECPESFHGEHDAEMFFDMLSDFIEMNYMDREDVTAIKLVIVGDNEMDMGASMFGLGMHWHNEFQNTPIDIVLPDMTMIGLEFVFGTRSLRTVYAPKVTRIGQYGFLDCGNFELILDNVPEEIFFDAFTDSTVTLTVPQKNLAAWQEKLGFDKTGYAYGGTVILNVVGEESPFKKDITFYHEAKPTGGYSVPASIYEKEFTYSLDAMGDAPALDDGDTWKKGKWTYDEASGKFVSTIDLTKADFSKVGDYWYEIKETTTGIDNYTANKATYYLHVVVANLAKTGEPDNIGVLYTEIHSSNPNSVVTVDKTQTELTFALPDGYNNAYSGGASAFDWGASEDNEYQVGYYYADDGLMDFDLYCWEADEGEDTATLAAQLELEKKYPETKKEELPEITTLKADDYNGFDIAFYEDEDEDENGTTYKTWNYIVNDGNGYYVEFVFWMDENDNNAESKVNAILASLANGRGDKTDTIVGEVTPGGSLAISLTESGTATSSDDKLTVIAKFTLTEDMIPKDGSDPAFTYTITKGGTDVSEGVTAKPDWNGETKTLTYIFKNVPTGSIIKFTGLPDGVSYKISEDDLGEFFQNPKYAFIDPDMAYDEDGQPLKDGNDKQIYLDNTSYGTDLADCYASGTISDDNDEITVYNKADVAMDVGAFLENKPFMAIFGTASAIAACAFVYRKKRINEDNIF